MFVFYSLFIYSKKSISFIFSGYSVEEQTSIQFTGSVRQNEKHSFGLLGKKLFDHKIPQKRKVIFSMTLILCPYYLSFLFPLYMFSSLCQNFSHVANGRSLHHCCWLFVCDRYKMNYVLGRPSIAHHLIEMKVTTLLFYNICVYWFNFSALKLYEHHFIS